MRRVGGLALVVNFFLSTSSYELSNKFDFGRFGFSGGALRGGAKLKGMIQIFASTY